MSQMSKKEKAAIIRMVAGGGAAPKKKRRARARKVRNSPQKSVNVTVASRAKRRRGNKAGKRGRASAVTTAGNMTAFTIPIDEQVAVVSGTTGFGIQAFALNPGNPNCFPFASRTTQNYERYEFEYLHFYYKPSASVFATVGAQGFVGITGTMDALQATPSSQQQAEIMLHSNIVETAKSTSLTFPKTFLETKSMREKFFVRPNGFIPGGADPHLYDCGQVFFWTNGQANTNQIGEFRVTGRCKLINPVLETSSNPAPQYQIASFQQASSVTNLASGTSVVLPLATQGAAGVGIPNSAGTFTPPVGNYMVSGMVNFAASGSSSQFNANIQKNGALVPAAGLGNDTTLPSAAYAAWSAPIPPTFVSCNGVDTITVNAQCVFQSGAVTAGGYVTFQTV